MTPKKRGPAAILDHVREEVTNGYLNGLNIRTLGEQHGVHWTTVHKTLAKWGVQMRARGHQKGANGWKGKTREELRAEAHE
jgi:hypothetical protein